MGCGASSDAVKADPPSQAPPTARAKTPRIVVDKARQGPSSVSKSKTPDTGSAKSRRPEPDSLSLSSSSLGVGQRPPSQRSLSITINNHLAAPLSLDEGRPPDYPTVPGRCFLCGSPDHVRLACRLESPAVCKKCGTSGHSASFCSAYSKLVSSRARKA